MKSGHRLRTILGGLPIPGPGLLAMLLAVPGVVVAAGATFTTNSEFDLGTLDGVNYDVPDEIRLSVTGSTFPIMWIANAGEDTVSKIDTDNNEEIARYRTWFNIGTHGAWSGPAPSRTAVDGDGNVYVANRQFGRVAEVMKILADGGIDRNGNGVIDTSEDSNNNGVIDPGEIIPIVDLNSNGIVDDNELADERVAWIVRVGSNNGVARALCIGPDGNIWTGLFNARQYYKLSSTDGSILEGPISTGGNYPYGCLVDGNGILWSADRGGSGSCAKMGKLDTNTNTFLGLTPTHSGCHYSIALGKNPDNDIYLAIENQNLYRIFDPDTNTFSGAGSTSGRGISVDGNGDIVSGRATIQKHDVNGIQQWSVPNPVGNRDQRGVLVDSNNDVWVVNLNANSVSKFRGTDGAFITTLPVGRLPYTYSDATGFAFRNVTNPSGLWTVVHDGGTPGAEWDSINWNNEPEGNVPPGASLTIEARAADDLVSLANAAYVPVGNGATGLGLVGQYIGVRATLSRGTGDITPVLSDLTVVAAAAQCDVDGDGDVDRSDLGVIMASRNTPVPPGDPALDINQDGVINANDSRACVLECTLPRCVSP